LAFFIVVSYPVDVLCKAVISTAGAHGPLLHTMNWPGCFWTRQVATWFTLTRKKR
jgi:hypothetical protein